MKEQLIKFYLENEKTILVILLLVLAAIIGQVQESTPEMR